MKTEIKVILVSIVAMTLAISGCYYDNEEDLYIKGSINDSICSDTTNVTYSKTIAPIFASNCNSCHSGGSPNAGIATDNFASVVLNIDRIMPAIHYTGAIKMPPDGPLSPCDLTKIDIWVRKGHLNN
jgi:hypothetical protein